MEMEALDSLATCYRDSIIVANKCFVLYTAGPFRLLIELPLPSPSDYDRRKL